MIPADTTATVFGSVARFRLLVGGAPSHEDASTLIDAAVLRSIALWRHACWECGMFSLTRIDVNDRSYVHAPLYRRLQQEAGKSSEPPGPLSRYGDRLGSRGTGDPSFADIRADDPAISVFCGRPVAEIPADLQALRDTDFCDPVVAPGQALRLEFTQNLGACAQHEASHVVACEANRRTIRLNSRDYKFYIGSTTSVLLGNGKLVDLEETILHEIGHWLGLDHLVSPDGIMNAFSDDIRCIDRPAIDALNAIVSGRVSSHATVQQALLYRGGLPSDR